MKIEVLHGTSSLSDSGLSEFSLQRFSHPEGVASALGAILDPHSRRIGAITSRLPLLCIAETIPAASICSTKRAARL